MTGQTNLLFHSAQEVFSNCSEDKEEEQDDEEGTPATVTVCHNREVKWLGNDPGGTVRTRLPTLVPSS